MTTADPDRPPPAPDPDLDALLSICREAAGAAAAVALAWRRRGDLLRVEEKAAPDDLVSQADREAERAARDVIARHRPGDEVVGEEAPPTPGATGVRWVIDPIDGTTSFLYGRPDWSVSVAAVRIADGRTLAGVVAEPAHGVATEARLGGGTWTNGRRVWCTPAADLQRSLVEVNFGRRDQRLRGVPVMEALLPAVRDVRRGGSAAAAFAMVATGRSEAYWAPGLASWDGAAGLLLVTEAGGRVGTLAGPTEAVWPEGEAVLAAAPALWEPLRALLEEAWSARDPAGAGGRMAR